MKNVRNSKTILLLIAVALIAAIGVGGTVAYLFTSTPPVTNTFEPAGVPAEIEEQISGNTKQSVTIKNVGNVNAFVRAKIVATWQKIDENGNVYVYGGDTPVWDTDYRYTPGSDWTEAAGFYYYNDEVAPGDSTSPLFTNCSPVAGTAPEGYNLHIEILAQTIQSEGMGANTAQDAWSKAAE